MNKKTSDPSPFTALVQSILKLLDPKISDFYVKRVSLFNYGLVCGVGVLINMKILGALFDFGLGLYVSNAIAILVAFLWNWTFSVGPYGYIFDLNTRPAKKEAEELEEE